jgi:hypothetical protein
MKSAFARYEKKAWPYKFNGTLVVRNIAGGTPSDPNVAKGWLTSMFTEKDEVIVQMIAEVMAERGISKEEATEHVDKLRHLNGFKRDEKGLYLEGRCLKAALKEACSVAVASGKLPSRGWGKTNKGLLGFMAEHVHVVEDRLHLGVSEPSGILQGFVHTFRGNAIQYQEYVEEAKLQFTIEADYEFKAEEWAIIWLTGERQGLGASRSQGMGRYTVTDWKKQK